MRYILTFAILAANYVSFAQRQVVNEEINITKEREVTIPKSTKIAEKIAETTEESKKKKMNYTFFDRKPTGIEEVNFTPNFVQPSTSGNSKNNFDVMNFNNYVKVGLGNYGRIFTEAHINSDQDKNLVYGLSVLHNSAKKGPIDGVKSGQNLTRINLDGKYHQNDYEVKMKAGFETKAYHFYGYDTTALVQYEKNDLRQRLNLYSFATSIENTKPKNILDYKLSTGVYSLSDRYGASEFDWATNLHTSFALFEDKIKAIVNADAYLTQMQDDQAEHQNRKRQLFRVEPAFNFDFGSFSAKVGFKAVVQKDPYIGEGITKGYPTATLTYKLPSLIYFFAGIDGDIARNTMRSLLNENVWLKEQVTIQNTYKNAEYFVGSRGDLFSGLTYNFKTSFGKYRDLYYFDQYDGATFSPSGVPLNVTKFDVVYDQKDTKFANVSLEMGYSGIEIWKPNLKLDYNYYEKGSFEKPFHRPSFTGRLGNSITLTDRLVSSVDFYYIGGIFARNTPSISGDYDMYKSVVKMKDIIDLNAEFTYLFTDHLSGFVRMNNILGKNYQRYYNYPQMGLNFLIGINIAL